MSKLRIVIADDHAVLRSGLKLLLESQADMEVVGEAFDVPSAIHAISQHRPDVMTVDLSMPGGDGFELLRKLKNISPTTRLVVLTMHEDPAYFRASVAAGGDSYVLKKSADNELMSAIRASVSGHFYSTLNVQADAGGHTSPLNSAESILQAINQLSEREQEVLKWVAQGMTNQQVADKLSLSVKTIESYRSRLMHKLSIHSRAELVRFALDVGMLHSDRDTASDMTPP